MTVEVKKRKRGRPPKAAQSIDEALARLQDGESPSRPRNKIERLVFGKTRGRPRDPGSRSAQAGSTAAYLAQHSGVTLSEAARQVSEAFRVHPDTVRRYARKALASPTVVVKRHQQILGVSITDVARVQLLKYVADEAPDEP